MSDNQTTAAGSTAARSTATGASSATPGTPLIEVRDIGKSYGSVIALRDVTATVRAGEVTCVLGDNGAGKSTFIKILAGAHPHSSGRFLVDGTEQHFSSPARRSPSVSRPSTRTSPSSPSCRSGATSSSARRSPKAPARSAGSTSSR